MSVITREQIMRMAQDLSRTASDPAFLKLVEQIQCAPEEEKLQVARGIADVGTLRRYGIEPPADFRISPRTFEEPPDFRAPIEPNLACESGRVIFCYGGVVTVIRVLDERG